MRSSWDDERGFTPGLSTRGFLSSGSISCTTLLPPPLRLLLLLLLLLPSGMPPPIPDGGGGPGEGPIEVAGLSRVVLLGRSLSFWCFLDSRLMAHWYSGTTPARSAGHQLRRAEEHLTMLGGPRFECFQPLDRGPWFVHHVCNMRCREEQKKLIVRKHLNFARPLLTPPSLPIDHTSMHVRTQFAQEASTVNALHGLSCRLS